MCDMTSQLSCIYYLTYQNHLRHITEVLSRNLPGGTENNENPVRIATDPPENRTELLPNTSLESYRNTILLGDWERKEK
jgi:hypothetical protein